MVPVNNLVVAPNGPHLVEVTSTITKELNKRELGTYSKAIDKVVKKKKLNVLDLKILDKVDEITMATYGLCLKDSLVTKARLKACKRYNVTFNDRDGLVDHLRMVEETYEMVKEAKDEKDIVDQFINVSEYETIESFADAALKVYNGEDLSMDDWEVIARVVACTDMSFDSIKDESKLIRALEKICTDNGIDVYDILRATKAFNNIH